VIEQVLSQGAQAVRSFFQPMNETERRRQAPRVLALYKAWSKAGYSSPVEGIAYPILVESLPCALLACANLNELKSVRSWFHDNEVLLGVLEDRRPDWLSQWAGQLLERNPYAWGLVRTLCRRGWIDRPPGEAYVLGLIVGARRTSVLEMLERDSQLLENLPELFEVEGHGEFSLAAHDKYLAAERSWSYALLQLSQSGRVERSHLLRLSLEALRRDFENFRAGWYSRFHESLQPTAEERTRLTEAYLPLLGSRVRPTVSFALKALQIVARAGLLPVEEFAVEVGPALASPDKGTALMALKLLLRQNEPADLILERLGEALRHPQPEVQATALEALEKREPRPDLLRWSDFGSGIAASLQARWRAWLGGPEPTGLANPVATTPAPTSESAVVACASLDELIQRTARILEAPQDPIGIEVWLDGLVRFPRPDARLAAPLLKRARRLVENHNRHNLSSRPPLQIALARLVCQWLDPARPLNDPQTEAKDFLQNRLAEVALRLHAGPGRGLLALPDHPAGWVEAQLSDPDWPVDQAAARWRMPHKVPDAPAFKVEVNHYSTLIHRKLCVQWGVQPMPFEAEASPDLAWRRWQSIAWPAGREFWACQGLEAIANNLDWWEAAWADRVYLENLLLDLPMGPRARLLLAFGLACKQSEQVGLAVDACLLALGRGHLNGGLLGESLQAAAATEMIKPSRWARSLEQVASAQPAAVLEAIQAVAELGELLPLMWELCHQLGQSPHPQLRERLAAWPGGGKQARLARQLAALI
jgi:hypothetical protein